MARVAIIGGGIGGLATALFLGRRGHTVEVFERDSRAASGDLDADFLDWQRPRIPQATQPHAFLAPVRTVLRAETPDVYEALLARGAREYNELDWFDERPPARPGDEDLVAIRTRRIVLETVLTEAVSREPGVRRHLDEPVEALVVTESGSVPQVTGVCTASGAFDADLVIDAAGRRSVVGDWLAEAGCRAPVVESHSVGRAYFSRWYRLRPDGPQSPGRVWDVGVTPFAINLVFPSDNGVFAVTFAVPLSEPGRLALRDPDVFDRAARRFPASGPWLALEPDPLGEVQVMAGLDNRWVSLVDQAGPVVTGLVGVGDSVTHTNPTLGQGVAMALLAAQRVAATLGEQPDLHTFSADYYGWAAQNLKPWFDHQVRVDAGDQVLFAAKPDGPPSGPPSFDDPARVAYAATPVAMADPIVMRARAQVRHLAVLPAIAFADPEVRGRLDGWLAAQQGPPRMPRFVSRDDWDDLLDAAAAPV